MSILCGRGNHQVPHALSASTDDSVNANAICLLISNLNAVLVGECAEFTES